MVHKNGHSDTPSPPAGEGRGEGAVITVPGFIDLHTHLREPGFEYKEDIASGLKAAHAGGYTQVFCMANTKPVNDNAEVTRFIYDKSRHPEAHAEGSPVHLYPIGAISKNLEGKELADIEAMHKAGVIAISDDGCGVQNDALMKQAMLLAKKLDILVISHAEDTRAKDSRDAENNMIARDIKLAKETGCRLHVAHVSTKEGIELVRRAKKNKINVTCEVTPHHLLLTEDSFDGKDANFKMNPPLRKEEDRLALIDGINDGTVDAIATDHAPHSPEEKKDFATAANGVIGMETAFPVCYSRLCHPEQSEGSPTVTLNRLIDLFTTGPAKVAKIKPTGTTTIDLKSSYTIDPDKFLSKARNTPFKGWKVHCHVRTQ